MNNGYIALHRKFLDWEWFDDTNMVKLFIYLLLKSNHKDNTWQGIDIKRGQCLTGLTKLSESTKLTIQTLRTCLKRLEKTGEINMQVTNKYRVITICNYDSYQDSQQATNKQTNKQLTSKQQATNKQLTANNNEKNVDNDKKDNKEERSRKFYKSEIEKNKSAQKINNYRDLVNFLFATNPLEKPLTKVLSMGGQISYKNYLEFVDISKSSGIDIRKTILALENTTARKYKTFSLTLRNWIDK